MVIIKAAPNWAICIKAGFPLDEFVRANKQKANVIGWWLDLNMFDLFTMCMHAKPLIIPQMYNVHLSKCLQFRTSNYRNF